MILFFVVLPTIEVSAQKASNDNMLGGNLRVKYVHLFDIGSNSFYGKETKYKYSYSYDKVGNLFQILKESITIIKSEPVFKIMSKYDKNGNEIEHIKQRYISGKWVNNNKTSTTYTASGQPKIKTVFRWQTNSWQKKANYTYKYNKNDKLLEFINEIIKDGSLLHGTKQKYTYDASSNMLVFLSQESSGKEYINKLKRTFTYNKKHDMLTEIVERWLSNKWNNSQKWVQSYNTDGMKEYSIMQNWKDNKWENSSRTKFTYTNKDLLTSILTEIWQNNAWSNSSRSVMEYNIKKLLTNSLHQIWKDKKWTNQSNETWTYNTVGMILTQLNVSWKDSKWVNNTRETNTYEKGVNLSSRHLEKWDGSTWINYKGNLSLGDYKKRHFNFFGYKISVEYDKPSDVKSEKDIDNVLSVYPNPSSDYLNIIGVSNASFIKIYNINGELVSNNIGKIHSANSLILDISKLPNGIYFIRNKDRQFEREISFVIAR